jgi:hypothetical protein
MPRGRTAPRPFLILAILAALPFMAGGQAALGLFKPVEKWLRRHLAQGGRYHHVFMGEVRLGRGPHQGQWVASGWHHRFQGVDPPGHRVTTVARRDANGSYAAGIQMRAPNGQWVDKPHNHSFFPDNWTPQQVSDTIHSAFANGRTIPGTNGRRWEGMANGIRVNGSYNQTGKAWNSGWPVVE